MFRIRVGNLERGQAAKGRRRWRREAPQCNSPDREVGVSRTQQTNEARRADTNSVGPSDLANHFQHPDHDLTVVAIRCRPFGPSSNGAKILPVSSLNAQRNLAQMMFSKRLVRLADFFQSKRFVHVDLKWARIDQGVESVD